MNGNVRKPLLLVPQTCIPMVVPVPKNAVMYVEDVFLLILQVQQSDPLHKRDRLTDLK